MAEGGVDNSIRRNSKDEFTFVDARGQSRFGQQAVVRSIVEREDAFQNFRVVIETSKHRGAIVGKLGGNQAMSIALINGSGSEHGFSWQSFFLGELFLTRVLSYRELHRPPRR